LNAGAPLALDHLVVAARTLDEGVDWCDATFGLRPEAGGRHALMGTHNRVFALDGNAWPRAYFEIIAIDPAAAAPQVMRWFDLDDPALQQALSAGPQLVHWVARCSDIVETRDALRAGGIDCGEPAALERVTPHGLLRWQFTLRADGRRPLDGAAPALIAWSDRHPTDALPPSGIALEALDVSGWPAALAGLLPPRVHRAANAGAPPLRARLAGRRASVILTAPRSH
jgi:hypothetical protein